MRTLNDHITNPANDKLVITVIDEPGSGGANHLYHIALPVPQEYEGKNGAQIAYEAYCQNTGWKSLVTGSDLPPWDILRDEIKDAWNAAAVTVAKGCARNPTIRFQNGPINEVDINGITHESLLAILIDRLRGFQNGPYKSRDNACALTHLEEALMWLNKRTLDRMRRGVEGTHTV